MLIRMPYNSQVIRTVKFVWCWYVFVFVCVSVIARVGNSILLRQILKFIFGPFRWPQLFKKQVALQKSNKQIFIFPTVLRLSQYLASVCLQPIYFKYSLFFIRVVNGNFEMIRLISNCLFFFLNAYRLHDIYYYHKCVNNKYRVNTIFLCSSTFHSKLKYLDFSGFHRF